jgi:hypothetical protein
VVVFVAAGQADAVRAGFVFPARSAGQDPAVFLPPSVDWAERRRGEREPGTLQESCPSGPGPIRPPNPPAVIVMHGWTIGATEQAGRLREELVHCVLVSYLSPGLGHFAVTKVVDKDLVVVQLLARSLAADGK